MDTEIASDGKASFLIKRLIPQMFGMINQAVVVAEHAGKTLEFSAAMKADNVGPEGGCSLLISKVATPFWSRCAARR